MRAHGMTLLEVVFSSSLAVVAIAAFGTQIGSQRLELAETRREARAHALLMTTLERAAAGKLVAPRAGETVTVASEDGVVVTAAAAACDERLTASGALAPVAFTARWGSIARPRERQVVTLVPGRSR